MYLGQVKEITGALKISHSYPIVSLDFFRSLETIRGESDSGQASLQILKNENLARLFPIHEDGSTVRILSQGGSRGTAFIHYNGKLCRSEIEEMIKKSKMETPEPADVSFTTNGDQSVCSPNKLNVTIKSLSPRILMLQFDNYQEVIAKANGDYRALLGYQIHYRKTDRWTAEAKNLTKYEGRDACGGGDWVVMDKVPSGTTIKNGKEHWPKEGLWVMPLDPYNYYAFFVSTMLIPEFEKSQSKRKNLFLFTIVNSEKYSSFLSDGDDESDIDGAESDIQYFLTDEDYPDPPESILVEKTNYSSLNVSWLPPKSPNGVIDHYEIELQYKRTDIARTLGRDYCKEGFRATDMEEKEKEEARKREKEGEEERLDRMRQKANAQGMCPCDTCSPQKDKPVAADQRRTDTNLEDHLIDLVFSQSGNGHKKRRRKRSIITDVANEQVIPFETDDDDDADDPYFLARSDNLTRIVDGIEVKTLGGDGGDSEDDLDVRSEHGQGKPMLPREVVQVGGGAQDFYYWTFTEKISGDELFTFVGHLKHYGSYTLRLRACHKVKNETRADENGKQVPTGRFFKRCSR